MLCKARHEASSEGAVGSHWLRTAMQPSRLLWHRAVLQSPRGQCSPRRLPYPSQACAPARRHPGHPHGCFDLYAGAVARPVEHPQSPPRAAQAAAGPCGAAVCCPRWPSLQGAPSGVHASAKVSAALYGHPEARKGSVVSGLRAVPQTGCQGLWHKRHERIVSRSHQWSPGRHAARWKGE